MKSPGTSVVTAGRRTQLRIPAQATPAAGLGRAAP